MKISSPFYSGLVLSVLVSGWSVERTTLQVETRLFVTAIQSAGPDEPGLPHGQDDPDIVAFARLLKPGLGRGAAAEAESLKRFFNLPALTLQEEARTAEMTWSEDYQAKKGRLKVDRRVRLGGRELLVVLIPEYINAPPKPSRLALEVHRVAEGRGGPADILERVLAKEISWSFEGPLVLGFFFPDRAYFLTMTVQASMGFSGGRLGGGFSWTL